nr:MAG TPA: hypothetical protein [Caudoviricetes sp.]
MLFYVLSKNTYKMSQLGAIPSAVTNDKYPLRWRLKRYTASIYESILLGWCLIRYGDIGFNLTQRGASG